MSTTVRILVEDIATKIATYSKIELERADTVGGAYAEITELTLVADTFYYSYADSSGDINKWYKYRFSNAGETVKSDYSNPFQVDGVSRLKIRQQVLIDYRAGLIFEANATGSTTTTSTDDYRVKASVYRAGRGKNSYLYAATGAQLGNARTISDSTPSTGLFTVNPAWAAQLATGVQVEWHWLVDPDTLNAAINRGLQRYYYVDRVPINGVTDQEEYSLASIPWIKSKKQITGLWHYPLATSSANDGIEEPWNGNGRWWDIKDDHGIITIMINPGLTTPTSSDTRDKVYLEAVRQIDPLHTDASVAPSVCNLELAAALAYDEVLANLLRPGQSGTGEDRKAWEKERVKHQRGLWNLYQLHRPRPRLALPTSRQPVAVAIPWRSR